MKKRIIILALALLLSLVCTACKGADTGVTSLENTMNEIVNEAKVSEKSGTLNTDNLIIAEQIPTAELMTLGIVKNTVSENLSFKSVTNMRDTSESESSKNVIGWLLITNNGSEDIDIGGQWMKADGELLDPHQWEKFVRIPIGKTGWLPVYGEPTDRSGSYWVDLIYNEIDYIDKADDVSAEVVTAEGTGYPAAKFTNNSNEMISYQYLILLYKDGKVVDAVNTLGGKTIASGSTVIHYPSDWDVPSFKGYADFDKAEIYYTAVAYK